MKEYRSRENSEDLIVTVESSKGEEAKAVFEMVIELVRKENRRQRMHGGSGMGYTVRLVG